jgi:hypothetical protein
VQLLVSVIAFQGDRHPTLQFKSVKLNFQTIGITAAFYGSMTFIVLQLVVPSLDRLTALQCKHHDWPAAKHQVHMDWCAANGYSTN